MLPPRYRTGRFWLFLALREVPAIFFNPQVVRASSETAWGRSLLSRAHLDCLGTGNPTQSDGHGFRPQYQRRPRVLPCAQRLILLGFAPVNCFTSQGLDDLRSKLCGACATKEA